MPISENTANMISRLHSRSTSPVSSKYLNVENPKAFSRLLAVLLEHIPANTHIINFCNNRLFFALAFSAGILKNSPNILPQNRQPGTLTQLSARYPKLLLLTDAPLEFDLPEDRFKVLRVDQLCTNKTTEARAPNLELWPQQHTEQQAATVFTSGSTGQPKELSKTWGQLSGTARKLHARFECQNWQGPIVATVPSQHMYGLEMAIALELCSDLSVVDSIPFYPEDIANVFRASPSANLVTTPFHLKNAYKKLQGFSIGRVISATAPLELNLAKSVEKTLHSEVHEILGCSEAGSFATRRTVATDAWSLLDGFSIWQEGHAFWIHSDHLRNPVMLEDQIEAIDASTFRLLGRSSDMLNVAGKRSSISEITKLLLAVPEIEDAAVFVPTHNNAHQRPAALIVGQAEKTQILKFLAEHLDPIFIPRPLKFIDEIPRNSTGKLVKSELEQLL